MRGRLRGWVVAPGPREPPPADQRRLITAEMIIVFSITLGLSGLYSLISLVAALRAPGALSDQEVALNAPAATDQLIDLLRQLAGLIQLAGWGALGAYLVIRAGLTLRQIGLDRSRPGRDALGAILLAAAIGIPGLVLYLVAHAAGLNLTVQPSTLTDTWWRLPVLVLSAAGNSWVEEVLLTGYLLTRLRQLGWSNNRSLLVSALLRGCYHLYQGFGGFVGNLIMGLVFGRVWQRTSRLWVLLGAHLLLDLVAFLGYALLAGRVAWLP